VPKATAKRKSEAERERERQEKIMRVANDIVDIVKREGNATVGELVARTGHSAYWIGLAAGYIMKTVKYIDMVDDTFFVKKEYREEVRRELEAEEAACREAEEVAKKEGIEI
jgi:hypothetical protein